MSKTGKTSLKLPIWLMVGPIAGIFLSIIIYAIVNFSIALPGQYTDITANATNVFTTIVDILLFIVGALSVLIFVPCLIFGIIMLSKRRNNRKIVIPSSKNKDRNWKDLD